MHRIRLTYCLLIGIIMAIVFNSCSDAVDSGLHLDSSDTGIPVTFTASLNDKLSSRVAASEVMPEFYVYSFAGRVNKGRNVKYTWNGSAWQSDKSINWPTSEISFWGLSRTFANGGEITNSKMVYNQQYFNYTVFPDSAKNLFYASKLNTTSSALGGNVHLDFVYSLAYPYFTAVQAIDNVSIYVKEIIVHNLKTTGTLTFSTTNDSEAKWTLVDSLYGDYKQVLPSPIELNPDQRTAVQISDPWIFMPQMPTKWKTKAGTPVSIHEADSLRHSYVEIKCKMIQNGSYVWGAPSGVNEYESVYFPFSTNFRAQGFQRAIKLTFTGGYLEDGTPLVPHSGTSITVASWVTMDVLVDPWEEMPSEDLEF